MTTLQLALDWTPNVNHIGFFVANELGFYNQLGIHLNIISPSADDYATTPAKKLEQGVVDLAIAPFESVISLNNKINQVNAIAIYTVFQHDLSCIATLKSSNITTAKQLQGKIYASYKARYEDSIVKEMIKNDGADGDIQITYPSKLGIWHTLLTGQADATWIFDNWEGIEAETQNIALQKFKLSDYNIPYGYSPIVLTKKENILQNKSLYAHFIQATQKGFLHAKHNISTATEILKRYASAYDVEHIDIEKAIQFSSKHIGDETSCGKMKQEVVFNFMNWLVEKGLESKNILQQHLFTNELFEAAEHN